MAMMMMWLALAGPLVIGGSDEADTRVRLDNGIEAVIVRAPDATKQTFFTMIPFGLVHDDAGCTQWAHLVEHMLIRATDPDALEVDGIKFNGETTTALMRLESIGEPARWQESLARHGRWLAATACDGEVLEREKGRVGQELGGTVPAGHTAKWAMAAWNQVVRHGRDHAALLGDIDAATAESLATYIGKRVPIGAEVLVAAIGPIDPALVEQELRATFGALKPRAATPAKALAKERAIDREASWDLTARHYLEWYPLPTAKPTERVASLLLAQLLFADVYQQAQRRKLKVQPVVAADVLTPEGAFLMFSVGGFGADDDEAVRAMIAEVVKGAQKTVGQMPIDMMKSNWGSQVIDPPDFAALRRMYAGRPGADFLEAQVTLGRTYPRLHCRLDEAGMQQAFADLDATVLKDVARRTFGGARGSLLLRPVSKP